MPEKLCPKFKDAVSETPGGENIKRCYQCGTCNVSCPIREIDEKYNPRKIIRMVILGMKERVLSSDFIWLCTACYTCQERCPQDVRIPEVMNAIKNLAVKEGYVHSSFIKQAKAIESTGWAHVMSEFEKKRRQQLGLPLVFKENPEVQEIFRLTGLNKLIHAEGSR